MDGCVCGQASFFSLNTSKHLRQQRRRAVAVLPEQRANRRSAQWAGRCSIPLAPRGDALLAKDVAALELDGRSVLLLADGTTILAELDQLLLRRAVARIRNGLRTENC